MTSTVAAVITHVYRFFVRDSLMMYLCKYVMLPLLLSLISDVNKDLGPPEAKAKAKDWRSHKANKQRQYLKVKDDNDHKFYVFHS